MLFYNIISPVDRIGAECFGPTRGPGDVVREEGDAVYSVQLDLWSPWRSRKRNVPEETETTTSPARFFSPVSSRGGDAHENLVVRRGLSSDTVCPVPDTNVIKLVRTSPNRVIRLWTFSLSEFVIPCTRVLYPTESLPSEEEEEDGRTAGSCALLTAREIYNVAGGRRAFDNVLS